MTLHNPKVSFLKAIIQALRPFGHIEWYWAGSLRITWSPAAGETALAAGVLAQLDHLFDYYRWYFHRQKSPTYLLFHA